MDNNLLSSYAFLASLNETNTDLYKAVYIPLCKRAISIYAKEHTAGNDSKIQSIIKQEFGIDIPLLVTRKLIVNVFKDLSRKDKDKFGFQIFEQGKSFQFKSFVFDYLDEFYKKEQRNANALQCAFETFLKEIDILPNNTPSFASFITKYQIHLSSFLSGKIQNIEDQNIEESYMIHTRFLQFIEKNDDQLYNIAKRIFVGSIIASYIESEIDVSARLENNISYYLDTKVVLEALDLQKEEDTLPTKELLKLIENTGGKIKVLDVTVAEIHSTINAAIQYFNQNTPTSTINEACIRRGKSKTWLTQFNGNIEKNIVDTLNASVCKVSESDIVKYSNSDDVKLLKQIWYRKNAAEHDVIAYLYVRDKRKFDSNKIMFQKASCWFVTENKRLCDFNISRKINGYTNEVILPQELTSLLFLQNPQKYSTNISIIGLNELIAQTISDEYPSRDIINEFDKALKESSDVTGSDYEYLVSEISYYSTTNLQRLIEQSASNSVDFNTEIHNIIARSKQQRSKEEEERRRIRDKNEKEKNGLIKENTDLAEKLSAISKQLEDLQLSVDSEKNQRIDRQKKIRKGFRISAWIAFLLTILIFIVQYFANIQYIVNSILNFIKGAGGLWAFGNLAWNIITKNRNKDNK